MLYWPFGLLAHGQLVPLLICPLHCDTDDSWQCGWSHVLQAMGGRDWQCAATNMIS